jgi:hypothetical protein
VRRVLTWLAGLLGIAALLKRRSRSRAGLQQAPADPALELREKLEQARSAEAVPEPAEPVEQPPGPAEAEPEQAPVSLEERRARVHERAQEAISLMRGAEGEDDPDEPPGGAA